MAAGVRSLVLPPKVHFEVSLGAAWPDVPALLE